MALAAVAALSGGVSMASATTVTCGGVACADGTMYNGTLKSGTDAKLTSTIGTITCQSSVVLGAIGTNGTTPVSGSIQSVHFSSCSSNIVCYDQSVDPITASNVPYNASITTSTLTATGSISVSVTARGACGALTCAYTAPLVSGTGQVQGSISGSDVTFNQALNSTGGACPFTATWQATYTVRDGTTAGAGNLVTVD